MKEKLADQKQFTEGIRRLGNPYAKLGILDQPEEIEASMEQKKAYFRRLENPHAHHDIFGVNESRATKEDSATASRLSLTSRKALETLRMEVEYVLNNYRPYVARKEWNRLKDYRSQFIEGASRNLASVPALIEQLRGFKVDLMPGEKIEYNRAPASQIIDQLQRLLSHCSR